MGEFRRDPLRGHWVIIAPGRSERPDESGRVVHADEQAPGCPFCPGHERETPPEVDAVRPDGSRPDAPGWRVRIVPNKYPALVPHPPHGSAGGGSPLTHNHPAAGRHEVIVATPEHRQRAAEFSAEHWEMLLSACQARMQELMRDPGVEHVLLFQNHGFAGGASLSHAHLQLMALPMTLDGVAHEVAAMGAHHAQEGRCLLCDLSAAELAAGTRLVGADDSFVSFTPWASRTPYEVCIVPRAHHPSFLQAPAVVLQHLAEHLRAVLRRAERLLGDFPYNLVLHTAPKGADGGGPYHWHLDLLPRLMHLAGFEWGTGSYINAVAPETAASELRASEP